MGGQGVSRRRFAELDGCDEGLVRRALREGRLIAFDDGTIEAAERAAQALRVVLEVEGTKPPPDLFDAVPLAIAAQAWAISKDSARQRARRGAGFTPGDPGTPKPIRVVGAPELSSDRVRN